MKTIIWMLASVALTACSGAGGDPVENPNEMGKAKRGTPTEATQPTVFDTEAEAASKAASDLLELIGRDEFDFGVSAEALRQATPGTPIPRRVVEFAGLLEGAETTFAALSSEERTTVVPMETPGPLREDLGSTIATIVDVRRGDEGWFVVGVADAGLTESLNAVQASREAANATLAIYEIPNLQATVLVLTNDQQLETAFTDYGDFSLEQGSSSREVIATLRTDARAFQEEFGGMLQEQNLVR